MLDDLHTNATDDGDERNMTRAARRAQQREREQRQRAAAAAAPDADAGAARAAGGAVAAAGNDGDGPAADGGAADAGAVAAADAAARARDTHHGRTRAKMTEELTHYRELVRLQQEQIAALEVATEASDAPPPP